MAASGKVQVISTKYFMCINQGHYVIYLQNMKFERLILWPGGAYTDAMHILILESWLHRVIGKYPKWAKKSTKCLKFTCKWFRMGLSPGGSITKLIKHPNFTPKLKQNVLFSSSVWEKPWKVQRTYEIYPQIEINCFFSSSETLLLPWENPQ